jgi:hypothetical protein
MANIDPHIFNPTLTTIAEAHGYEVKCATCGLGERMCKLIYKPMPPAVKIGPTRPDGPCEHFVGRREWGMFPQPWRTCQECGWPKAQHELPRCTGALNIAGKHYQCELKERHVGLACSNREAQAIWASVANELVSHD